LVASTPQKTKILPKKPFVTQQALCFGACPIYSVEITPAGEVQFDGKQYTKVTGTQELKVDPSVYKKLQKELETYRPTTGANVKTTGCTETATDHPSSYFWWKGTDGTVTRLSHYTGCISPANMN
jgi:hypothetical protein